MTYPEIGTLGGKCDENPVSGAYNMLTLPHTKKCSEHDYKLHLMT